MLRILADKISSSTFNLKLSHDLRLQNQICAEEGYVLAGRIIGEKGSYNSVEDCNGRMVTLQQGDILVGTLGRRDALHGYCGYVPSAIQVGDRLNVLNLGGVIGKCSGVNPDLGAPYEFEVLGAVQVFPDFNTRSGVAAHVTMHSLQNALPLQQCPVVPIVYVLGTCMNAGKTTVACRVIRSLASRGLKVAACKLTGVSLLRDTLNMQDYGAKRAISFMHAGIVSTGKDNALSGAQRLIAELSGGEYQVIVAELGDGILGNYGVQQILAESHLMQRCGVLILCANDPVGAWGAVQILREQYGLNVDLVSGPTTDNQVGIEYIRNKLKLPAINARTHGAALGEQVLEMLSARGIAAEEVSKYAA